MFDMISLNDSAVLVATARPFSTFFPEDSISSVVSFAAFARRRFGREEDFQTLADDVFGHPARQRLEGAVDPRDAKLPIPYDDQRVGVADQVLQIVLGLLQFRLHPLAGNRDADAVAKPLEKTDRLWSEPSAPVVVELKQADGLVTRPQRDQSHGFVASLDAVAAGEQAASIRRRGGQQFGEAVAPEAAVLGEERQGGIETAAEDVPAQALERRRSAGVACGFTRPVARAEAPLGLHEMRRKAFRLIVGKVLALSQTDAHRLYTRAFLDQPQYAVDRVLRVIRPVQQFQNLAPKPFPFLRTFAQSGGSTSLVMCCAHM